ncbi:hypothetical protein WICPIJ_002385 [Wickerhamomyces pijperi]|uniref:Uncharacterized protein n=1 Tax=Wickerhamomyces pijperi TaxID=599730 RepID=A0A9P8QBV2_WICPI|nr:hypothetical protein WICPIJ_002385 [Wickerhamomyces pijperi]
MSHTDQRSSTPHFTTRNIFDVLPTEMITLILDFSIKTNSYHSYMNIKNRLPEELLPYLPRKLLCLITNGCSNSSPTPTTKDVLRYQQKKKSLRDIVDLDAFPLSCIISIGDLESLQNLLNSGYHHNLLFLFAVLDTTQRLISWLDFDTEEEFEEALREQKKLQRDAIVLKNNFSITNTISDLQKCLSLVNDNLHIKINSESLKFDWILYGAVFSFYNSSNADILTNSIMKSSKDLGINVGIQYFKESNPLSHTVFMKKGEIVSDTWAI